MFNKNTYDCVCLVELAIPYVTKSNIYNTNVTYTQVQDYASRLNSVNVIW